MRVFIHREYCFAFELVRAELRKKIAFKLLLSLLLLTALLER